MGKKPRCTKAIAYVRVSTGKQELSPEVQVEKIQAYCNLRGLELAEVITETVSAKKVPLHKRPQGQRIRQLTDAGVCHIVAMKLDRIFRSAKDALTCAEEWDQAGIALHIVDMGGISIDTKSSGGKLFFTMMAGFAEFEASVIAERTAAVLGHKKAIGEVYGHVPFGMRAEDGKLVEDASEQAAIASMQAWRAQEPPVSYAAIAQRLNEAGIPTKQAGKGWGAQSVLNILARLK